MDREIGSRRRHGYVVCALVCGTLALPASGLASSGGSGLTPGGSGTTPTGASTGSGNPTVQSGNTTVSTNGNGVTLQTSSSAMLRNGLSFSGTAPQNLAG